MDTATAGDISDGTQAVDIGFAIPSEDLKAALPGLEKGGTSGTPGAYLGVEVENNTPALVSAIAPAFTLVVHDSEDSYCGPEHPLQVIDRALPPKELWWISDAGHGSDLLTDAFADRLLAAVRAKVAAAPKARAPGIAGGIAYVAAGTGAFG